MKYLILGAGPAGLSVANKLIELNEDNFLVLEAENEAGGLCRSQIVDGAPLDIGGGHFLDVRRPIVNAFLFKFMPMDEWNLFDRNSQISIHGTYIDHPIEANIWQLNIDKQVNYLKSIAMAGCNTGKEEPKEFVDWIYWKLGDRIADNYMIPYNFKLFGKELYKLGTYWMEKLPNVSFEDTLRSCLMHKAFGEQPGHARFYYPKKSGYGELWLRMAKALGDRIEYNKKVIEIDIKRGTVLTNDGAHYEADRIVTTIPWTSVKTIRGLSDEASQSIDSLKYSSIQVEYCSEDIDTDAHWIYYPEANISYHRILVRKNFCLGSKGYWTETNIERIDESKKTKFAYLNEYAYPLNTIDKPLIMKKLLRECEVNNVFGLGRWGNHQHYNSDLTVEQGMKLAEKLSV